MGLSYSSGPCSQPGPSAAPRERIHPQGGDVVRISTPELGTLVNEVVFCDQAETWTFGTGPLMANLARRGVLGT